MRTVTRHAAEPLRIFHDPRIASFLERPNRFLVRCRLEGRTVEAFLPNRAGSGSFSCRVDPSIW
jgi:hypothetical protein